MSDDSDDNERAIGKVVKKSVSDVFGEEDKPEPTYTTTRYEYPVSGKSYHDQWKRDNPGFAFQRAGASAKTNLTAAAWGKPRDRAMRPEYDDVGNPTSVNFTVEGWKELRARVLKGFLKELDWERLVLALDDHVVLEQVLDTIMRRAKFQAGKEGNSYSFGSLVQVPMTVGDDPPVEATGLPASSIDLDHDGWGKPGDDEDVIDLTNPGDDNDQ